VCRPEITLVEFEQIYDEYIQLCNNQAHSLESEEVYVSLLNKSIFLN